jgi:hypothetical protein
MNVIKITRIVTQSQNADGNKNPSHEKYHNKRNEKIEK